MSLHYENQISSLRLVTEGFQVLRASEIISKKLRRTVPHIIDSFVMDSQYFKPDNAHPYFARVEYSSKRVFRNLRNCRDLVYGGKNNV